LKSWGGMLLVPVMKLTINIDDELMARVKDISCAKTNEEAAVTALVNFSELEPMKAFFSRGPHPTAEEIRNALDSAYVTETYRDLLAQRG